MQYYSKQGATNWLQNPFFFLFLMRIHVGYQNSERGEKSEWLISRLAQSCPVLKDGGDISVFETFEVM